MALPDPQPSRVLEGSRFSTHYLVGERCTTHLPLSTLASSLSALASIIVHVFSGWWPVCVCAHMQREAAAFHVYSGEEKKKSFFVASSLPPLAGVFEFPLWAGTVIGRLSVTSVTDIESWNTGILTNKPAFFCFPHCPLSSAHHASCINHGLRMHQCANTPIHQCTNQIHANQSVRQHSSCWRVRDVFYCRTPSCLRAPCGCTRLAACGFSRRADACYSSHSLTLKALDGRDHRVHRFLCFFSSVYLPQ